MVDFHLENNRWENFMGLPAALPNFPFGLIDGIKMQNNEIKYGI